MRGDPTAARGPAAPGPAARGPASASGIGTPTALVALITVWALGCAAMLLEPAGLPRPAVAAVGALAVLVSAWALTRPDDPVRVPHAVVVACAALASTLAGLAQLTAEPTSRIWLMHIGVYFAGLLAVRGRLAIGWSTWAVVSLTAIGYGASQGWLAAVAGELLLPTAALVTGTVWHAFLVRGIRRTQAYREAGARARLEQHAVLAASARGTARRREIADVALHTLSALARGVEIDAVARQRYGAVESTIRDRLRAPRLGGEPLRGACARARLRGVQVVLLDDGGGPPGNDGGPLPPSALEAMARGVAGCRDGRVVIRIAPAGQPTWATVLIETSEGVMRRELSSGPRGSLVWHSPVPT